MRRFGPFMFLFVGIYILVRKVYEEQLHLALDETSLGAGLMVGMLTGGLWFMLSGWWTTMGAADRPQKIILETKETPNQVSARAFWAFLKFTFVVAFVLAVAAHVFNWWQYLPPDLLQQLLVLIQPLLVR